MNLIGQNFCYRGTSYMCICADIRDIVCGGYFFVAILKAAATVLLLNILQYQRDIKHFFCQLIEATCMHLICTCEPE